MARLRMLPLALSAVVIAGLAVAHVRQPASPPNPRAAATPVVATASPAPSPLPATPAPAMAPARLLIPKIGVDAAIESVGEDGTGSMGVPGRPLDVGWYSPGPAPGEPGDAVIDGHLDWYGLPRAVFADLGQLRPGDEIDVRSGNGLMRFTVTDTETVAYDAQPAGLFATTGAPRLSLITCAGAWDSRHGTYAKRLLVNAAAISD